MARLNRAENLPLPSRSLPLTLPGALTLEPAAGLLAEEEGESTNGDEEPDVSEVETADEDDEEEEDNRLRPEPVAVSELEEEEGAVAEGKAGIVAAGVDGVGVLAARGLLNNRALVLGDKTSSNNNCAAASELEAAAALLLLPLAEEEEAELAAAEARVCVEATGETEAETLVEVEEEADDEEEAELVVGLGVAGVGGLAVGSVQPGPAPIVGVACIAACMAARNSCLDGLLWRDSFTFLSASSRSCCSEYGKKKLKTSRTT